MTDRSVHSLAPSAIEAAHAAVPPAFRDTPQFVSEGLTDRLGAPVVVKVETANPLGCFKGRGTWLAMRALRDAGRVGERRGVVVASAGNFGQGVAYAGRALAVPVTIFAAATASTVKVDAMRVLGADVRLSGADFDAARQAAAAFAADTGRHLLVDGQDPNVATGAGTMAVELTRAIERGDLPRLEAIYVPVGNGALIAGIGTWMRAHAPTTRVIGIQAAGAPAMTLSWRARAPIETSTVETIADGIAARVPVIEALEQMFDVVDEMVLVTDDEIRAARDELSALLPLSIEPSAAAGWAAARRADPDRGARALVLTGGNVAPGSGA